MSRNSEFRSYSFIETSLSDLGWDLRNPTKFAGGQVYTQNESLYDPIIGKFLKGKKPENIVKINETNYWVIEAKAEHSDMQKALEEAKEYASLINKSPNASCLFISGVAGTENNTFLVETYYLSKTGWERVNINSMATTGFLSQDQAKKIIDSSDSNITNELISEELFLETANDINKILHNGAINKKNRARVIASLLLALVKDEYMHISEDPTTLIEDINARVRSILRSYGKENFAQEIAISLPTSKDNHIKNRRALVESIQLLRNINIKSALNSGSDLLGQFYEIFLKYANDSKEIGIVLTPRHITQFAAEILNINESDYVYDPTCGTGGFLVSAFDYVKKYNPNIVDEFKLSHIIGVDQDPEVVGLALVNMIFRGDGNSNIYEGNTFDNYFFVNDNKNRRVKRKEYEKAKNKKEYKPFITKVLMNPPFAQNEKEFEFVDHALKQMKQGGLLFAVLPTSIMSSSNKKELQWRKNLLARHTLKSVIKLSEDLFLPNAHKGTYAVIIEAWKPHDNSNIMWGLMDDGFVMKKAKRLPSENLPSNIDTIKSTLKRFLILNETPELSDDFMSFKKLDLSDDFLDCSPEANLPYNDSGNIDLSMTSLNLANSLIKHKKIDDAKLNDFKYKFFSIDEVFEEITRGDCPPTNRLGTGNTPVVSTTEQNNGIDGYYDVKDSTIHSNSITIPANGSTYKSFFHPYDFSALPDVLVCKVKPLFDELESKIYICAVLNQSSWRFSYFRKCNEYKLKKDVNIPFPVTSSGDIDFPLIKQQVNKTKGVEIIKSLILLEDTQS